MKLKSMKLKSMKLNTLLTSLVVILPVSMTSFANEPVANTTADTTMTVKAATVQSATSLPNVHATQDRENTVFVSPRTGMRYSVSNPSNRKIIFQTEGLKPVTAQNVDRIRATNPVISAQSQEQAKQKLLDLAGIQPTPVQAPSTPTAPQSQSTSEMASTSSVQSQSE